MKFSVKKAAAGVLALGILAGLIALAVYLKHVADYQRAVRELTIEDIRVADVADGTYAGECDVDFIYAKVEVTVQDGRMTDIRILEHRNGRGQAAEAIVDDMVSEQRIDVDAVSGATNSSTVLKKAAENALRAGIFRPHPA